MKHIFESSADKTQKNLIKEDAVEPSRQQTKNRIIRWDGITKKTFSLL